MATPQLSPGVLTREVDLTVGRVDNVLDNIGAIAGPFPIGPVDFPIDIATEQDLINVFGKPLSTDAQYEYWMSASSFLSYGGVLKVVRCGDEDLNNANAGVGIASTNALQVLNYDDYSANHYEATNFTYAAKNPGSWANGLKVCTIDDFADQTIGISTVSPLLAGAQIGYGVTAGISTTLAGVGTESTLGGYLKGIIVGVTTDGTNGNSTIDVKIVSRVSAGGTETAITYAEGSPTRSFDTSDELYFVNNSGINTGLSADVGAYTPATSVDWYDQQVLTLENATIFWKTIAPRPITNQYVLDRNGKGDGLHLAVVDDYGLVTGNQGTLIEKHVGLSKALDAVSTVNAPQKIYYKQYIADFSANVYAGYNPSQAEDTYHGTAPRAVGFSTDFTAVTTGNGLWGQTAQDITFSAIGNVTYSLAGGEDYSAGVPESGSNGRMKADLGQLMSAYRLFSNRDEIAADYLIMGPGGSTVFESQAKANQLISIAEERKDCIAVIGPHRTDLVGQTNTTTQTNNLIRYFGDINSSSYAVFDSGYKYTYDRFNNEFRYIPVNADIAGLMCRTNITAYPWFSPDGQQRGIINNAIKLAYNPNKAQRDQLYPKRVNSIITKPGVGTMLFGDKTALGYASAFDKINVRRLFITVEQALQRAAEAQLFELNDELTRANFRNIIEPYLRDIEAKRGIYGFLVVCDTTNNTPCH